MSNDAKFVDGLRVYAPRDGAPSFVKANLVVNVTELTQWLEGQGDEVRIDIKESRGGKFYASVNDYKADKPKREPVRSQPESDGKPTLGDEDEIPFAPRGKRNHWE
mgnify:CR=1 FL=1